MPVLAVIGDINIEISGRVETPFSQISGNVLSYGPLLMRIGGTASNLAEAAAGRFDAVRVLGSVGIDDLGDWALRRLVDIGADVRLSRTSDLPTGLAVSINDSTAMGGTRLLVVRSDNANRMLTSSHIKKNADVLAGADFLMTDGYSLLSEPRRSATLEAMRMAAAAKARVVVDVVPHDCYRLIDLRELREWLTFAHIVVAEVETARRLLGLNTPEGTIGVTLAIETMERFWNVFPDHSLVLRFGIKNIGESLVCRPGRGYIHRHRAAFSAPANYTIGDELTVDELMDYFTDGG